MATDKPDLRRIWAEGAPPANIVDPDVQEPGKFNSGWEAEVPPFEYFNFLQQLFTQGLAHINERGVAVWDTDTTYPIGAVVTGSDANRYIATSEQDGNDPVSNTDGIWIPFALASNPNIIPTNSKINPIVVVDGTTIPSGTEVSTGWFAQTDLINPTYVDSKWNANSGIIYRDIVIEEGLEFYSATDLVSSIADETRNPRKLGISVDLAVSPGFVRVLVDFASANEVFSAKVEVGSLPSLHNVSSLPSTIENLINKITSTWVMFQGDGTIVNAQNVSSVVDNGSAVYNINFDNELPNANYGTYDSATLSARAVYATGDIATTLTYRTRVVDFDGIPFTNATITVGIIQ